MSNQSQHLEKTNTIPTDEHIITYNLQLQFRTKLNDGEVIAMELEQMGEEFDSLSPKEQIDFLLQLVTDLQEDKDDLEYESIHSVTVERLLRTTFKVINSDKK